MRYGIHQHDVERGGAVPRDADRYVVRDAPVNIGIERPFGRGKHDRLERERHGSRRKNRRVKKLVGSLAHDDASIVLQEPIVRSLLNETGRRVRAADEYLAAHAREVRAREIERQVHGYRRTDELFDEAGGFGITDNGPPVSENSGSQTERGT